MHSVLKVQPWPTLAGMKSLIEFGVNKEFRDSYFRADHFCKYYHDDVELRRKTRKLAVDRAESAGDGPILPIVEMDKLFYERKASRTIAELNYGLVSGASSSLSQTALDTLPIGSRGVVLRTHFSVTKQVTQRLWTATTPTLASPLECTASERASRETRHSCLSVHSLLSSFLDRGCFSAIASSCLMLKASFLKVT